MKTALIGATRSFVIRAIMLSVLMLVKKDE